MDIGHTQLIDLDAFPKGSTLIKREIKVDQHIQNKSNFIANVGRAEVGADEILVAYDIKKWNVYGNGGANLSFLVADSLYINELNLKEETKELKDLYIKLKGDLKAKNFDNSWNQELVNKIEENMNYLYNFDKKEYSANSTVIVEFHIGAVKDRLFGWLGFYESGGRADILIELSIVKLPSISQYNQHLRYVEKLLLTLQSDISGNYV
jgi:hypothetical protein